MEIVWELFHNVPDQKLSHFGKVITMSFWNVFDRESLIYPTSIFQGNLFPIFRNRYERSECFRDHFHKGK